MRKQSCSTPTVSLAVVRILGEDEPVMVNWRNVGHVVPGHLVTVVVEEYRIWRGDPLVTVR